MSDHPKFVTTGDDGRTLEWREGADGFLTAAYGTDEFFVVADAENNGLYRAGFWYGPACFTLARGVSSQFDAMLSCWAVRSILEHRPGKRSPRAVTGKREVDPDTWRVCRDRVMAELSGPK